MTIKRLDHVRVVVDEMPIGSGGNALAEPGRGPVYSMLRSGRDGNEIAFGVVPAV